MEVRRLWHNKGVVRKAFLCQTWTETDLSHNTGVVQKAFMRQTWTEIDLSKAVVDDAVVRFYVSNRICVLVNHQTQRQAEKSARNTVDEVKVWCY